MTDPVNGISSSQGPSAGGGRSGGGFPHDHRKKKNILQQNDLVEISRDARERSSGKGKKSILEYLKELFG